MYLQHLGLIGRDWCVWRAQVRSHDAIYLRYWSFAMATLDDHVMLDCECQQNVSYVFVLRLLHARPAPGTPVQVGQVLTNKVFCSQVERAQRCCGHLRRGSKLCRVW